jgi:hypothetical protein
MRLLRKFIRLLKVTTAFEFGHRHVQMIWHHKKLHHLVSGVAIGTITGLAIGFGCAKVAGLATFASVGSGATISKLSISNNAIIIDGKHLGVVKKLKINDGQNTYELKIATQKDDQITLNTTAAFSLIVGAVYNLLVTTANAADAILPITVQVADGTLSPTALSGGGATVGQVLQWNGTAWTPASNIGGDGGGINLWLANIDGSIIGKLITFDYMDASFSIWDDQDAAIVNYVPSQDGSKMVASSSHGLITFYTTSNCSDYPHAPSTFGYSNSLANTAWVFGNKFYRVEIATDNITVLASRTDQFGNVGSCSPRSPSTTGNFQKLTEITNPGVPTVLPIGSFKIIKQ